MPIEQALSLGSLSGDHIQLLRPLLNCFELDRKCVAVWSGPILTIGPDLLKSFYDG